MAVRKAQGLLKCKDTLERGVWANSERVAGLCLDWGLLVSLRQDQAWRCDTDVATVSLPSGWGAWFSALSFLLWCFWSCFHGVRCIMEAMAITMQMML